MSTCHRHHFSSSSSKNEFKIYNKGGALEPSSDAEKVALKRFQAIKLVLDYYNKHQQFIGRKMTKESRM